MVFFKTQEFITWFNGQNNKTQGIIQARLLRIENDNHWGMINKFDELIELKWTGGLRIYTAKINNITVILLGGGNKNGQSKDIQKAKSLLKKIQGNASS